jgi:DNA transformation protein and related proteins
MPVSPQFQEYVLEVLEPLAPVTKRMFSGAGIFAGGIMFGLLVRDTMFFRVDDRTRQRFEDAGSEPFSYTRNGRKVNLGSYYAVPEDLFDRPDELLGWARQAVAAAHAAARKGR